jgi:hypothetical protein
MSATTGNRTAATSGITTMSEEQMKSIMAEYEALKLAKEKQKARDKAYMDKNKEKLALAEKRRQAGIRIILEKAKAAKIGVSEKEIDEYLAAKQA